jgi:hypothetical protein
MQIPINATNYLFANEIVKHSNNKRIQVPSDHAHSSRETWHPQRDFRNDASTWATGFTLNLRFSTKI